MALRVEDVAGDVDIHRDRTLVERYQAGDDEAFEELYRRYQPRLVRYCEKRLGDRHEAEEVAQDAFVRAMRAMPGFAGERRFYPWLTVIASRLCVDSHRRRARTTPEAEIDLGAVDGGQDAIVAAVDTDLLRTALDRLGPRHREVLYLRETEGWSYQRIADHYGVSMSTVEALLFRARKALKREFLSIAPRDGGFLAGVPVIGYLLRRFASLRARFEAWNAGNVLPVAANVSAAVAIGSVAVLAPLHTGGGHSSAPTVTVQAATGGSDSGAQAPAQPRATAPSAPLAAPPSSSSAGGPPPSVSVAPTAAAPERRGVAPATVGNADQSDTFTQSAPVRSNAGPVALGIDPQQLVTSSASNTAGWAQQLVGGHQ